MSRLDSYLAGDHLETPEETEPDPTLRTRRLCSCGRAIWVPARYADSPTVLCDSCAVARGHATHSELRAARHRRDS